MQSNEINQPFLEKAKPHHVKKDPNSMVNPDMIRLPDSPLVEHKLRSPDLLGCVSISKDPLPLVAPNINPYNEIKDIETCIHNSKASGLRGCDYLTMVCCSLTIVGSCFVCKNTVLINNNQYGFIVDNGQVSFLKPGWHFVGYPLMNGLVRFDINSEYIQVNNLHIIRIKQDELGIALNNTLYELLMPGTHLRLTGNFRLLSRQKLNSDLTEGPLKIKTVKTGTVSVCYNNGVAEILTQGRYAINSNGFLIGQTLDITQQNLKFSKHKVLLEGGINMLVEGLLTYQIEDVGKLIRNVEIHNLNRYLEDVMKADLTKVFSTIHLEQIANTNYHEMKKSDEKAAEIRLFIYESIMKMIKPQADQWGVKIINFQLESTQLADQKYSLDYEAASLQIAKSAAELKAQQAQNTIQKQKAETAARIAQMNAETEKNVKLIEAKAKAEATIMEADARAQAILKEGEAKATAASMMKSQYGQDLALLAQKAKIAEGLKIHTLVMGGTGSEEGKSIIDKVVPVLKL